MTLLTVVVLRKRTLWVRRIVHRRQTYTGSKKRHDQQWEGCKCKCGIKRILIPHCTRTAKRSEGKDYR